MAGSVLEQKANVRKEKDQPVFIDLIVYSKSKLSLSFCKLLRR